MEKQTKPRLTERERGIFMVAKNLTPVYASAIEVGIVQNTHSCKTEVMTRLVLERLEKKVKGDKVGVRSFRPLLEEFGGVNSSSQKIRDCYNGCVKYLSDFVGKGFIINTDDGKKYTDGYMSNAGWGVSGEYVPTTGLYTFEGVKIPGVIGKDFRLDRLEVQRSKLKKEDFDLWVNWFRRDEIKDSLLESSLDLSHWIIQEKYQLNHQELAKGGNK